MDITPPKMVDSSIVINSKGKPNIYLFSFTKTASLSLSAAEYVW